MSVRYLNLILSDHLLFCLGGIAFPVLDDVVEVVIDNATSGVVDESGTKDSSNGGLPENVPR